MAKITKFKVINMACFLGLFGVFTGLLYGIIGSFLTLVVPSLATFKIWEILLGLPIGYGIFMFILALIFTPIINLVLKIIKGLDFNLDLAEVTSANTTSAVNSKPLKKEPKKSFPKHPIKSVLNPQPISQMTNSRLTAQKPVSKSPAKTTA